MVCSPLKVPNRLSATIIAHRWAAQYGQYSAPMYSTWGFPSWVSGGPLTAVSPPVTVPAPTVSSVDAGTRVTLSTTLASAVPVGPFDAPPDFGLAFALTSTKATTMPITTTSAPDARNTRLRISARRAAARWAAILSRADPALLVLLALPMACLPGFLTDRGCSLAPSGIPLPAAAGPAGKGGR